VHRRSGRVCRNAGSLQVSAGEVGSSQLGAVEVGAAQADARQVGSGHVGSLQVRAPNGTALATVLDLDRFELYERLRLAQPVSSRRERDGNARLMRLLSERDPKVDIPYDRPAATREPSG